MDIEQLNKFQIVLLTLLVSFVTSIATGIVTVSLLDQAPPGITQTINRVVERTIETVVPQQTQTASVVTTKETTVVVKEEDLITGSIEKNIGSFAKVYQGTTTNPMLGTAFVISADGVVVADKSILGEFDEKSTYLIEIGGGIYEATVEKVDGAYGLAFLAPVKSAVVPVVTAPKLASVKNAKLGQTVLALRSGERANVGLGIISSLESVSHEKETLTFIVAGLSGKIPANGTPLLNIFGEVVGISTIVSKTVDDAAFAPADQIGLFLASRHVTPLPDTKSSTSI